MRDEGPPTGLGSVPLRNPGGDEGAVGPPGSGKGRAELLKDRLGRLPGARHDPEQGTLTRSGKVVEGARIRHRLGAERIKAEVVDKFQEADPAKQARNWLDAPIR